MARFIIIFVSLLALPAFSDEYFGYGVGDTPPDPLTYDKLATAVRDPAHPLRSVEEVLAWISKQHPHFLEHFTLMRESRSSQEATAKDPRAIVFQSDGRLVLTFNGDKKEKGFDHLELMQFREPNPGSPLGTHFEFHEISFEKGKADISAANPNRCRQCHQAELRPIWPPYEIWPGSYGKYDDSLPDYVNNKYAYTGQSDELVKEQTAALNEFRQFSPGWRKHARYQYLKFPEGSPVSPFSPERRGPDKFRPNLQLTHLLSVLHARQLAGQIAGNQPCFENYQPLLLASLLDCRLPNYDPNPAIVNGLKDVRSALRESYSGAEKAGGKYSYDVVDEVPDLLALMGMEKEQWNPDENPTVWNYYVGVADIAGLVADALYPLSRKLTPQLPELSVLGDILRPQVYGSDDDQGEYTDDPDATPREHPPAPRELACDALNQKLATFKPEPALCRAKVEKTAPAVVGMCLSCHDGGTAKVPAIAFDEPEKLSADRKKTIVERISSEGPSAMPPTRHLSQGERHALLEFLHAN